jgi:hypothetical protein
MSCSSAVLEFLFHPSTPQPNKNKVRGKHVMCIQEYLQVIMDQLNKIETFLQLTSMLHFLLHEDWT